MTKVCVRCGRTSQDSYGEWVLFRVVSMEDEFFPQLELHPENDCDSEPSYYAEYENHDLMGICPHCRINSEPPPHNPIVGASPRFRPPGVRPVMDDDI